MGGIILGFVALIASWPLGLVAWGLLQYCDGTARTRQECLADLQAFAMTRRRTDQRIARPFGREPRGNRCGLWRNDVGAPVVRDLDDAGRQIVRSYRRPMLTARTTGGTV